MSEPRIPQLTRKQIRDWLECDANLSGQEAPSGAWTIRERLLKAADACESNAANGSITTSVDELGVLAGLLRKAASALPGDGSQ